MVFCAVVNFCAAMVKDDGEQAADKLGSVAVFLLIVVTLHCGGFW